MRQHNARHGARLQSMGNDVGYAGPELFDRVTGYVASSHPTLLAQFVDAYRGLRPTSDAGTWMSTYPGLPLEQRQAAAATAQQALAALAAVGAGTERHAWMVQHARAITQVVTAHAFDLADPARIPDAMGYRDQAMAENTIWWQKQTGGKVLLSAHNGHIGYESADPERYPKVQGAFLRERLGAR